MKNLFIKLRANRLSTKIILLIELVLILSSILFFTVSIINSRIGIRKSIRQRMLDIANCASGSVNGDILETLTAEDAGSPEYQAVNDALAIFRDNVELKYVYGIKDEGDGRFTFTVDPTINDPDVFGSEATYTEALASASRGTAAVDEVPYTDAWGTFYSAYSPVFDSSGKVAGIIAADFSVDWFNSQLSEQTRSTVIGYGIILLVALLIAAFLSLVVVTPFVRQQEQLALELEKKANENEQLYLQVVRSLADAVDTKDTYTNGHSRRVSQYSVMLAEALGWEQERIMNLQYAALLHDIGKISIPDSILNNPRPLTEVEYDIIKTHCIVGGDILQNGIKSVVAEDVARSHHERYDGDGYPAGLKGTEISEEARIVSIADAFDAMSSNRIYRKAYDHSYIRKELEEGRGTQFDPGFTDTFLDLWDQGLPDQILLSASEENEENLDDSFVFLQEIVEAFVSQSATEEIDVTTGILNRTAGEAIIAKAMEEEKGCFVFFDMDNLKQINDTSGHEAGDKILKRIGETLTANSKNSLCCRLGGDEFLFFMKNVSKEEAEARVQKIMTDFEENTRDDVEIAMATLSAGLVMCSPADPYPDVYNKADKALYHIKQNGKNSFSFYEKESDVEGNEHLDVDRLVNGIKSSGSYRGALDVEYRQFAKLYEYITNLERRFSHPFELILISLNTPSGKVSPVKELEKDMFYMEQSIQQTIRNVDIMTKYGSQHFLIILLGTDTDGVKIAVDRIFKGYYKMNGSSYHSPSYFVAGANRDKTD